MATAVSVLISVLSVEAMGIVVSDSLPAFPHATIAKSENTMEFHFMVVAFRFV